MAARSKILLRLFNSDRARGGLRLLRVWGWTTGWTLATIGVSLGGWSFSLLGLSPPAQAAGPTAEELLGLLHSAGGRFLLRELGLSAELLEAASGTEEVATLKKLRGLSRGLDNIREQYLKERPEDRALFESGDEKVKLSQRERLRTLIHREGMQSIEFVRAADEVRGYGSLRDEFMSMRPRGGGLPTGMTTVTDQGDTLECYLVTVNSAADLAAGLKTSARFTYYTKTKNEVIDLILGGKFKMYRGQLAENGPFKKIFYEQGGVIADAVQAFKVGGAMPEEVYPGFPKKDVGLFEDLNELIGEYARLAKPGKVDFEDPATREEVENKVTDILHRRLGKPPETFRYRGKPYSPQTFFADYLPTWQDREALELNFAPGNHNGTIRVKAFDGTAYRAFKTGSHRALMRVLEETLEAGYKPILQYKVVNEAQTQQRGKIGFEVHALDKPKGLKWTDKKVLDHYVLAIEPEWQDGHLVRLRIKNTWDTSPSADFGFHWIEPDYFSLFESVEIVPELEARFRQEGLLK